jgi:hypothetical protein
LDTSQLERFVFEPVSARSAAIFRFTLAGMLAWAFHSLSLQPAPPLSALPGALWTYSHIILRRRYFLVIGVLLVAFAAGARPRIVGSILFLLLLPLASLTAGQQSRQVLLTALLAFLMLRSDGRWSWRALRGGEPRESAGPIWPIRLIQIQVTLIYGVNALAKLTSAYLSGQILLGMSRMHPNFLVDLSDGFLHVVSFRLPVTIAATAVVLIEAFLAVGFWIPRLVWPTAVVGVAFHLLLQRIVQIYMLDLATMFLYLAFLLPWQVSSKDVSKN